nr:hypothetical protein [Tanacetum cinerariifolium]
MHPLDMAENILDSRNTSSEEGGLSLIGPDVPSYLEVVKDQRLLGKGRLLLVPIERILIERLRRFLLKQFPSAKELKDATNCHWVIAHVTPPFWKQHLREDSRTNFCIT